MDYFINIVIKLVHKHLIDFKNLIMYHFLYDTNFFNVQNYKNLFVCKK